MKRLKVVVGLLIMLCFICGCSVRHGDFTVISNKLIDTNNFKLDGLDPRKTVGQDIQHTIVLFPTSGPPTLEGALDDAFDKTNGDVLTDAVISSWNFYIPLLYGQAAWEVEGTAVKTRR